MYKTGRSFSTNDIIQFTIHANIKEIYHASVGFLLNFRHI